MPYSLLFADDSATMHRVVQITFAREDFTITAVNNGAAAIAKAKEASFDVAVIDISMPGMDGYAVCHALKSDSATAHIPVLLLAGSQEPFDEGRAQASGANSHVVKPFETQVLIDRVKTLVGAPVTVAAPRPVVAAPVAKPISAPAPIAAAPVARPAAPPSIASQPPPGGGWTMPAPGGSPRPPAAPPPVRPAVPEPQPMTQAQPTAAYAAPRPVVAPPVMTPSAPPPPPVRAVPAFAPAPIPAPVAAPPRPQVAAVVSAVAAKAGEVAGGALAQSGLDQATIMAMAREVLERVAWEVVPQLAEALIREQMAKSQGH